MKWLLGNRPFYCFFDENSLATLEIMWLPQRLKIKKTIVYKMDLPPRLEKDEITLLDNLCDLWEDEIPNHNKAVLQILSEIAGNPNLWKSYDDLKFVSLRKVLQDFVGNGKLFKSLAELFEAISRSLYNKIKYFRMITPRNTIVIIYWSGFYKRVVGIFDTKRNIVVKRYSTGENLQAELTQRSSRGDDRVKPPAIIVYSFGKKDFTSRSVEEYKGVDFGALELVATPEERRKLKAIMTKFHVSLGQGNNLTYDKTTRTLYRVDFN